jgi:hypothetical protein
VGVTSVAPTDLHLRRSREAFQELTADHPGMGGRLCGRGIYSATPEGSAVRRRSELAEKRQRPRPVMVNRMKMTCTSSG